MAEIRCPMCSKPNSEENETCGFCGARLKPLIASQPPQKVPDERVEDILPPREGETEKGSDWLARIRTDTQGSEDVADEVGVSSDFTTEDESPEWLGRLRPPESDQEEGTLEGEPPQRLTEAAEGPREEEIEPEGELPSWLSRIRERETEEAAEQTYSPPVDEVEGGWLSRIQKDDDLDLLEEDAPVSAREEPLQDLSDFGVASSGPASKDLYPPAGISERLAAEGVDSVVEPPNTWDSDEPMDIQAAWPSEIEPARHSEPSEGEIAWQDASEHILSNEILGEEMGGSKEAGPVSVDEPSVDDPLSTTKSEAEVKPEWLRETGDLEEELPRTPALILEADTTGLSGDVADLDLDDIKLPGWLGELKGAAATDQAIIEDASTDLTPATLPSWLEAMRPIETFQSILEAESQEDQVVESAGPLTGLRGVLMAEPIVAMPRSATGGAARLVVTERQYAQSELLHRMVEEEAREHPISAPSRAHIPILRWATSFFMILAVALPFLLPTMFEGVFHLPTLVPRELGPVQELVEAVPIESPVLLVFDYSPGYNGELEPLISAFLDHILSRGLRVATVSTSLTGPPLAEVVLSRSADSDAEYVHLGFLSGGPTAIQLFSADPRKAIKSGFMLDEDLTSGSAWESPILGGVTQISDFGMVAVITAGTESARTWTEQAYPWLGDTPMVMILSAGAEPMVRPYYEAYNPRIDGVLTGLPTALAYEQWNDRANQAQARWDAFGMGLIAVELTLVVGGVYGTAVGLLRFVRS